MRLPVKASAYNTYIRTKAGQQLVFNGISGTILPIDDAVYAFLKGNSAVTPGPLQMQKLYNARFVVADTHNEIEFIGRSLATMRENTEALQYTLVMTYRCNLKCPYCYEDSIAERRSSMAEPTAVKVLEHIEMQLARHRAKTLSLTLYGGEPLLNYRRCVFLLENASNLCRQNDLVFIGSLISNGVLLNRRKIETLSKYISLAQLTLEGGEIYHNRIRKTADGKQTFGLILDAIAQLVDAGIRVNVRIQVSPESLASLDDCFNALDRKGLLHNSGTALYFFPIMNIGKVCSARSYQCSERYYNRAMFAKLWAYSSRFPVKAAPLPAPAWVAPYCSFVNKGAWIIDPDGKKYKCVSMIGKPEGRCGDIYTGEDHLLQSEYKKREQRFVERSGVRIEACRHCTYLPICDGGCAYLAGEFSGSMDRKYCDMHQNSIKDHIRHLYRKKQSSSRLKQRHATI